MTQEKDQKRLEYLHREIVKAQKRLRSIEGQVEVAFEAKRDRFFDEIRDGKAHFDEAVLAQHAVIKTKLRHFVFQSDLLTLLTAPFIYGMIVPFVLLDLSLWIYQSTCFSAWGIRKVPRSDYIIIDRHRLAYLNAIQKVNCVFCGYANGLIAYAGEVAARTEQYWCPIKHALRSLQAHHLDRDFSEYGDAEGFHQSSAAFRAALRELNKP